MKLTRNEQETWTFLQQWMKPLRDSHACGFWHKGLDVLASYTGKGRRTLQRHMNKFVELGLLHKIEIVKAPTMYLDEQPSIEDALRLVFKWNPVKSGYAGHKISMYGADSRFYATAKGVCGFDLGYPKEAIKPVEAWRPDEEDVPY